MAEPSHPVVGPMPDAERVVLRGPDVKCGFTYGVDRPRSGKPQTRMKRCFTYRNNDCICSFNHAPHECDHERQWQGAATGCRSRDMPDLRSMRVDGPMPRSTSRLQHQWLARE